MSSSRPGDLIVLRQYYALFNERRLAEAAALVAADCAFEHVQSKAAAQGPAGYLALTEAWLRAAPDMASTIEEIQDIEAGVYRVVVVIRGTLTAPFEPSSNLRVAGDGRSFTLRATQRVRIRDGQIAASRLAYAPQELTGTPDPERPPLCPLCGERNTVLAWTRLSEQWMFCPICEHSWERGAAVAGFI
jgi:ketosteroid isomerase-like protein